MHGDRSLASDRVPANYPKRSQYEFAKTPYRVRNAPEYEAALRSRGDVTIVFGRAEGRDADRVPAPQQDDQPRDARQLPRAVILGGARRIWARVRAVRQRPVMMELLPVSG